VESVPGPNLSSGSSSVNGLPGDSDLSTLVGNTNTYDATVLEFDFVPNTDKISFQYALASEEYPEYISTYNDVFGFFINGVNFAQLPDSDTVVSIKSVNHLNNSQYYIDNTTGKYDTSMDGFTVTLSVYADVKKGEVNHIKLAVADNIDYQLDTNVFIKADSFISKPNTPPIAQNDSAKTIIGTPVILNVLLNDSDAEGDALMIKSVTNSTVGATVNIVENGSKLQYIPKDNFVGSDTLQYTISDGKGGTATATVNVVVENAVSTVPAPTNVKAIIVKENVVALAWDFPASNSGVMGYEVYRDGVLIGNLNSADIQQFKMLGKVMYSDNNVEPNKSYVYTVKAYDNAGNKSKESNPLKVTTKSLADNQKPTVPTSLQAIIVKGNVVALSWNFSKDNVGVAGYEVYRDGALIANLKAVDIEQFKRLGVVLFSDNNVSSGKSYVYTVKAYDSAGNKSDESLPLKVSAN
jgi:hypothetical protein